MMGRKEAAKTIATPELSYEAVETYETIRTSPSCRRKNRVSMALYIM